MNRRKIQKMQKRFNEHCLNSRQSCLYCVNWGLGCANGHPDIYPGDRSDYLYGCKEKLDAYSFLTKQLKRKGYSLSGWKLVEIPAAHVYVFYSDKKHKEIMIVYDKGNSCYMICSADTFWKYSDKNNAYQHDTVTEALKAPWQDRNYVLECAMFKKPNPKIRTRTLEKLRLKR